MLRELALTAYLDRTASGEPVPGGGSAAALNAALSAALIEMVANLTIGRKAFSAAEGEMRAAAARAAALRAELAAAIDRDAEAYGAVLAAYRLPKGSEAERAAREAAVQAAFRQAAQVPLEVGRRALELLALGEAVIARGNPNAASDGAAGVLAARMAVRAAVYNVRINLSGIADPALVAALGGEAGRLEAEAEARERRALAQLTI
jgi:formiminotetrahydrofolate cyclodeaminase